MEMCNQLEHNQKSFSSVKRAMRYINNVKFGTLHMPENEISRSKWSGGTAQLCTLEGTLVTSCS